MRHHLDARDEQHVGQPRAHLGHPGQVARRIADGALAARHARQRAEGRQAVIHAGQEVLRQEQRADALLIGQAHQPLEGEIARAQVGVHVHHATDALQRRRRRGRQREQQQQQQRRARHRRSPRARTRPS